ncbi:MAG TPA: AraC family transcriptional regulator [Mobilitalea sp.]|nr:AraC family transcriptional regulator [Mobilitalea sp.]
MIRINILKYPAPSILAASSSSSGSPLIDFVKWEEAFSYLAKIVDAIFEMSTQTNTDKNQKLINSIKNYIRLHLSEDLTLTTISDYVNYNSSYVSRLFKQTTGLSLSDYINQCRLNKAKELLMKTNDTIQVIAQKAGFDTSQYFSMVFRKAVGLTPRDFRNPNI